MQPLSANELKNLSDKELFDCFAEHARFFREAPEKHRYAIRLGSRTITSGDTADLRDKFFAAVRKGGLTDTN